MVAQVATLEHCRQKVKEIARPLSSPKQAQRGGNQNSLLVNSNPRCGDEGFLQAENIGDGKGDSVLTWSAVACGNYSPDCVLLDDS